MNIRIQNGLPFVTAVITYRGQSLELENVLLDTGSASCIFRTDDLLQIDLHLESNDVVHRIRGVGGSEFVFSKQVDSLRLGTLSLPHFEIEVGAMDYGFDFSGIIGMDFLLAVNAHINLNKLTITAP